jgi:hypothetical protein
MKVLSLSWVSGHVFEGWFASEDDFQNQLSRKLVECPVCASAAVHKLPSAPRLNLTAGREEPSRSKRDSVEAEKPAAVPQAVQQWQAEMMKTMRAIVASTEDVGERFAQEARKIHHGESQQRNIRGQATAEETAELLDEGIAIMPWRMPDYLKNPTH